MTEEKIPRYIVTEKELVHMREVAEQAIRVAIRGGDMSSADDKARAAWDTCLSREVPEWATHFTSDYAEGMRCEEIQG